MMVLSKNAISRSRAAWGFARTELAVELAERGLDSPQVMEAVHAVFARLDAEFAEAADAEPEKQVRRAWYRMV